MTITTGLLRLVHRIAGIARAALCDHIKAIRWRRRILRALDQRRRG